MAVPSVLVPLPGAPGDHQTANARALVNAGGAISIPDADFDGARMVAAVDQVVGERGRLIEMASALRSVARRDAAEQVAILLEAYAE